MGLRAWWVGLVALVACVGDSTVPNDAGNDATTDGTVQDASKDGATNDAGDAAGPKPGALDTTFQNGERTEGVFGNVTPAAVLVDSQSRVFVIGNMMNCASSNSGPDGVVIRLKADGTLDTNFGPSSNGRACIDYASYGDTIHAGAIDANGKLVVVGTTNVYSGLDTYHLMLTRIDATTGAIDNGFGTSGQYLDQHDVNNGYVGWGVTLSPTGQIYVVGTVVDVGGTANGGFTARFTTGGAPDTYGLSGFYSAPSTPTYLYGVAMSGTDTVAVGGTGSTWYMQHRTSTGTIVKASGLVNGSGGNVAKAVSMLADGTGYFGGETAVTSGSGAASVARVAGDGGIDTTDFPTDGGAGVFALSVLNWDDAYELTGLARQSDQKPLLVGRIATGDPTAQDDIGVARVTTTGALDTTYGKNGIGFSGVAGNEIAASIAVDPTTGNAVALGQKKSGNIVVVRFNH
jgi:uncharacterized delta-60 repeat protein